MARRTFFPRKIVEERCGRSAYASRPCGQPLGRKLVGLSDDSVVSSVHAGKRSGARQECQLAPLDGHPHHPVGDDAQLIHLPRQARQRQRRQTPRHPTPFGPCPRPVTRLIPDSTRNTDGNSPSNPNWLVAKGLGPRRETRRPSENVVDRRCIGEATQQAGLQTWSRSRS
jgi:hypothetical protein